MKYLFPLIFVTAPAFADPATIEVVKAQKSGSTWRFDVTLSHPDTGWDHYADGWRIETLDGQVLGTRTLAHPHVNEQPFTRALSSVNIPPEITEILIRASCNVDGWDDHTFAVKLTE
ncbi:hypothetical protein [Shimia abyssi]|uniref:Secreted protein n=1 Tax=Shimia abyssi TaxID=1662395 RepID=A0A2P8FEW9_9RHOB|nr:hypothetical protein [Shimia abyssi]PSL20218.1 hypothetical protein CLV88_104279 [Shimia abyssi]